MTSKEYWNNYGYVLASKYRKIVLKALAEGPKTPTQIANESDCNASHISRSLRELEKRNLVKCLSPHRRKGKLYDITNESSKIIDRLER